MKIMFLVEDYRGFYTKALNKSGKNRLSYREQCDYLYSLFFYHGNSNAHAARVLGLEAKQVIMDNLPIQDRWARENIPWLWLLRRRPFRWYFTRIRKKPAWLCKTSEWLKKILLHQVEKFKPDVIYIFSGVPIDASILDELRKVAKLLVCQWAAPRISGYPYQRYDLIVSAAIHQVEYFRSIGIESEYLPLAFDDRVNKLVNMEQNRSGVVFLGSVLLPVHNQRRKLLEHLAKRVDEFAIYGFLKNVPDSSPIIDKHRGLLAGLKMYEKYASAKIAIHSHIDMAKNNAGAKRMYEATGMGAMLLTDEKDNIADLFAPGKEIVTYSSPADCVEKIKYYLEHDREREQIARAGMERTLQEYTYVEMMKQLIQIMDHYIK
jgi:hypothetical protein